MLWASACSAVVLGMLSSVMALKTGHPQQVLVLMGFTGALLPGIPVFFGIVQEMSGQSGLAHFGTAAATSLAIATGVSIGMYFIRLTPIRGDDGPVPSH